MTQVNENASQSDASDDDDDDRNIGAEYNFATDNKLDNSFSDEDDLENNFPDQQIVARRSNTIKKRNENPQALAL